MSRVVHEQPVIIERDGGGGGMGMGIMLGVIMVVVLGLALAVFVSGQLFTANPNNQTPGAINAPQIDIQSPGITVPDRITIDTPQQPSGN